MGLISSIREMLYGMEIDGRIADAMWEVAYEGTKCEALTLAGSICTRQAHHVVFSGDIVSCTCNTHTVIALESGYELAERD